MMRKMLITGGLALVDPGSAMQMFVGILVVFVYLLILVDVRPFTDDGNFEGLDVEKLPRLQWVFGTHAGRVISAWNFLDRARRQISNRNSLAQQTGLHLFITLLFGE